MRFYDALKTHYSERSAEAEELVLSIRPTYSVTTTEYGVSRLFAHYPDDIEILVAEFYNQTAAERVLQLLEQTDAGVSHSPS
jgi:hypothetical protein